MRENFRGNFPHLIIIFGIYFGSTFDNGFCFGDEVLNLLGIKSWTGGNSGLHITMIYALVIALFGILLLIKIKKISFKEILSNALVYVFVVMLIFGTASKVIYKEEVVGYSGSYYKTDTYEVGLKGDVIIKNMSILKDKKQITIPMYVDGDINVTRNNIRLVDDKNNSYKCLNPFGGKTSYEDDSIQGNFDVKFDVENTKDKKYYKVVVLDEKGELFASYIYLSPSSRAHRI